MTINPQFGLFLDPSAGDPQATFHVATIADEAGLDLLTIQDHPYQWRYYETWTLITALAISTKRIRVSGNVTNLPLRLPAILAKQAATLDLLTGGRVEVGLGAGSYWEAIAALGGPNRTPGEAYSAFEDALHILRGMWENAGRSFSYSGKIYSVKGARPGPAPAHRIPIWVGATGPRMLRLTGRMADGLLATMTYVPVEKLAGVNAHIDEGAAGAGRSPEAIRRGYNIGGTIEPGSGRTGQVVKDSLVGPAGFWADQLAELYSRHRMDTFLLWVNATDAGQVERFAREVVPATLERIALG